jgi:acetylornithine deacetylase
VKTTKLPSLTKSIRELIATPSISSAETHLDMPNEAVIDLLSNWFATAGFRVSQHTVAPGKRNMIATLGGGIGSGEGLVLSGHTDTVPFDEGKWTKDPFGGNEADNRIYGLGSCDMKSFLAIALTAAQGFDVSKLRRPLTILATADEEISMSGAKHLLGENMKLGRYAVIGEPTGLKPIRTHKGVMMESIHIYGQSGHSSDPALGCNAIEGMHRVIGELMSWRAELQARYRNPAFQVETPTLNLGVLKGGDNPNRICGHCELQIDIRPLPGMKLDELREHMNARLDSVLEAYPGLQIETSPLFDGLPPFETAQNSDIVRVCENYTGQASTSVSFGTEAPLLTQAGLETIVMGPGNIAQAHQADEFLEIAQIQPTIDLLRKLIHRFCVEAK